MRLKSFSDTADPEAYCPSPNTNCSSSSNAKDSKRPSWRDGAGDYRPSSTSSFGKDPGPLAAGRSRPRLAQTGAWPHFRIVDLAQTKKKSTEAGNFAGGVPI